MRVSASAEGQGEVATVLIESFFRGGGVTMWRDHLFEPKIKISCVELAISLRDILCTQTTLRNGRCGVILCEWVVVVCVCVCAIYGQRLSQDKERGTVVRLMKISKWW